MNEKGSKRREWVKNVAIIFLAAMLVLTFFSNTIMNYSLPEVAVQYVESGSITAQIRGTGQIESDDPYDVIFTGSRKVESVMVREGDTVQKGDILFILAEGKSAEMEELQKAADAAQDNVESAKKALDKAMGQIEIALLNEQISSNTASHIQNGVTSSLATYLNQVNAADAKIETLQKEYDELELTVTQLQTLLDQLDPANPPDTTAAQQKVNAAQEKFNANDVKKAYDNIAQCDAVIAQCNSSIEEYERYHAVSGGDAESPVTAEEYQDAKRKLETYGQLRENAMAIVNDEARLPEYKRLEEELNKANTELNNLKNYVSGSQSAITKQKAEFEEKRKAKEAELTEANEEKADLLSEIGYEINGGEGIGGNIKDLRETLSDAQEEYAKALAKVDEERQKSEGASIAAPINGTVSGINVTAGHDTSEAEPNSGAGGFIVATMMPEGAGYTLSFSVTNEQARTLTPGIQADLVNAWRYDNVTATLTGIRPNPENPSQQKLLVFDVTGDVTVGQSLSLQVGDRSSNYDMIVPNSAIREDSNGKFVLTVTSKATPLSTRYTATRVDVEVVASDDTRSAITGGLYTYDYVITTSDIPVDAGQQVRLSGN